MEYYKKQLLFCIFLAVTSGVDSTHSKVPCEKRLSNCTEMMQPVLNEARYMFPVTQNEIEGMCQVWSHIMECVRNYVTDCSTEEQRSKFNEAVSNSIDSVHAICSSDRYRRDYLEYASCFRKVSMDNCGPRFKTLVDSAYNPHSSDTQICCAYMQYEKCVSEPIQRQCGPQALQIQEGSMSSLKTRCDIVFHGMKPSDKTCQPDETLQGLQDASHPRPAFRHLEQTLSPVSTPSYLVNTYAAPYTTMGWTPRTVIYPLPVTRHSSRISHSSSEMNKKSLLMFFAIVIIGMLI